ncbi:MAG: class I SAM-dependent DNA methyltransferase [Phycisphaerales bacterium]
MAQLEHIEAIEKRLWNAADTLRANSNYASNEYFLPVMGLIFLRHAYSRFLAVKDTIEANLPKRGGKTRALTKEDFSQKGAIFLQPKAQFDYLVSLPDGDDRAKAIIEAMESIEKDYKNLEGILPKSEYQELSNQVLGHLLRTLNPEELKRVSGDVFGRIYEYFLTQFADQKAHDGGEFFTPISLVSLIAHVIDPQGGTVLDPACGSGGMFVQSARTVEERGQSPTERLTFYGLEKNATTIRLAKMNLAVHGLEGNIQKAITYYEDPHELLGKADFVMANPPFNVDEIDADKVKKDPRLPFGLPGTNKKGKVSNGNYIWISYFYSYLNATGRAGFVMSSSASDAGGAEERIRHDLVDAGVVDVMIAVGNNFFYTRSLPCTLWFLDRAKTASCRDSVLMIDARSLHRRVTTVINDFSPEHIANLSCIASLYRGNSSALVNTLVFYARQGGECTGLLDGALSLRAAVVSTLESPSADHLEVAARKSLAEEVQSRCGLFESQVSAFCNAETEYSRWIAQVGCVTFATCVDARHRLSQLAALARQVQEAAGDLQQLSHTIVCKTLDGGSKAISTARNGYAALKKVHESRRMVDESTQQPIYFCDQMAWLVERFPGGVYCNVPGLCRAVPLGELPASDWSLSPHRYVGLARSEDCHTGQSDTFADALEQANEIDREAAEQRSAFAIAVSAVVEVPRIKSREAFIRSLFDDIASGKQQSVPVESLIEYHIGGGWGSDSQDAEHTEPVAVIRGTDIPNAILGDLSSVPRRFEKPRAVASRALEVGDLVFEVSGGSKTQGVGRCMTVTDHLLGEFEHRVICASFCKLIRPYARTDGHLLALFIRLARENGYLDRFESRSASNIINFKFTQFLAEFRVPVLEGSDREVFDQAAKAICAEIECRGKETNVLSRLALDLLPRLMLRETST